MIKKIIKKIKTIVKEIKTPTPEITTKEFISLIKDLNKNQITREIIYELENKTGCKKVTQEQRKKIKLKSKKELFKILIILKSKKATGVL